jgi:hypothetical protein
MLIPEHIFSSGRSSDLFRSLITFPSTLFNHQSDPDGKWFRVFKDVGPFIALGPELTAAGTVQDFHLIPF